MLIGETDKYSECKFFKRDILKATQTILKDTSASFDFVEIKKGRSVDTLHIKPTNLIVVSAKEFDLSETTLALLEEHSVNLFRFNEMLLLGEICEDYILYVVDIKLKDKKVKSPGGAIYKAIVEKHLWADFEKQKTKSKKQPFPLQLAAAVPMEGKESYTFIAKAEAERMYEQEKPKYPFPGFVKSIKTGHNILVEAYSY